MMDTASLQVILTEFLDEIQDLRANVRLLNAALDTAGVKISMADASDLKGIYLREESQKLLKIRKHIIGLKDESTD
jgi:hypothetical protein